MGRGILMVRVFVELDHKQTKIAVHFPYDPDAVQVMRELKTIGARFVGKDKSPTGKPYWTMPLDLDSAQRLRQEFGPALDLGRGITAWGRDEKRKQRQIRSLYTADDAVLERVSPESASWLRPYQRADIAMLARVNAINANQPGVGKTVEAIYATIESGEPGPHLVVCPTSLFKDPWRDELAAHRPEARVLWGADPAQRRGAINWTWTEWRDGNAEDIWLIINPEMARVQKVDADTKPEDYPKDEMGLQMKILSKDHKGNAYVAKDGTGDRLMEIEWGWVFADEFHKYGLGADRNTQFARGLKTLRSNSQRACPMSGTPTGGKPVRLFGPLNFVEPDIYGGKWKWAGKWMTNADGDGPVDPGAGTGIGGIQPGREDEFYQAHAKHLIRRTRKESFPGLPGKVILDVWCDMTPKQRKVYDQFMTAAEVNLDGGRVSADGVLAEYARAKQFANALCRIEHGPRGVVVQPTEASGKLPILLDRLDTYGVRKTDPEPRARAIVASESQRFVVLLEEYLGAQGLSVVRLDGTVTNTAKHARRDDAIDWFKSEDQEARVLVMTTQTGGVGLNLPMTGSIHVMDETWNPDDQEQLEDRGRAETPDRTSVLNILYYRTRDSIQEYIHEIGLFKTKQNKKVLADKIRQMARERN